MGNIIIVLWIYGLIVITGGTIGYFTAGSLPSLIMGGAFGLLLISSAVLLQKQVIFGLYLSMILTAALALFFGFRFFTTFKFLPAGLLLLISISTLIYLFLMRSNQESF